MNTPGAEIQLEVVSDSLQGVIGIATVLQELLLHSEVGDEPLEWDNDHVRSCLYLALQQLGFHGCGAAEKLLDAHRKAAGRSEGA